jgi:hypothetical protein
MPILLLIPFFLFACSENLMYNENAPRMTIEVLNVSDTILVGDSVYFQAKINPSPNAAKNYYWTINQNNIPIWRLNFTQVFRESGIYDVNFYALDSLGDTASSKLTISVSRPPVCDSLSLRFFQGSPIFEWNCQEINDDILTYNFILEDDKRKLLDTIFPNNFLQLGDTLPNNWKALLIATNRYNFKDTIRSAE